MVASFIRHGMGGDEFHVVEQRQPDQAGRRPEDGGPCDQADSGQAVGERALEGWRGQDGVLVWDGMAHRIFVNNNNLSGKLKSTMSAKNQHVPSQVTYCEFSHPPWLILRFCKNLYTTFAVDFAQCIKSCFS